LKEHRKFIRLQAPIGVSYRRVAGKRDRQTDSYLRDLSGGGIRFVAKDALRQGDLVELEIGIPHLAQPVKAVGDVIWYRAGKGSTPAEAGVRFRDVSAADLKSIMEYVYTIGIG
jgi:c-di-GMP-binding flagellar brake protein YcgR